MTGLEVKQLVMRLPGITPQEADRVATEVGHALAAHAGRWHLPTTLDELHLRIPGAPGHLSRQALVARIVTSIVEALDAKALIRQQP